MGEPISINRRATFATLEHASADAIEAVADLLTLEVKGARFMPAYKAGGWDGRISLFNARMLGFPAGLSARVADVLKDHGHVVTWNGFVDKPGKPYADRLSGIDLHPFQSKTVDAALLQYRAIIKSPTGSGKTEIGMEIARRLGLPTLWVCHRKDLMYQTIERIRERMPGTEPGAIGDGKNTTNPITVGMVQSLTQMAHREWWQQWKVLILDETHHASADTWYQLAMQCTNATWRFGLSATPLTNDELRNWKLEGATGPMIVASTLDELIGKKMLAKPHIKMLHVPGESYPSYIEVRDVVAPHWRENPKMLQTLGGKMFAQSYTWGIVENRKRTDALVKTAFAHVSNGERVMVLCTRIAHGEAIEEALCDRGIPCWFLSGREKSKERAGVLRLFREFGQGCVLVASTIFQEGIDLPELDTLILAGGGASDLTSIQRVGRALRVRTDKLHVLIYDFLDGRDPDQPRDYLANHTKQRIGTYQNQKFHVTAAAPPTR